MASSTQFIALLFLVLAHFLVGSVRCELAAVRGFKAEQRVTYSRRVRYNKTVIREVTDRPNRSRVASRRSSGSADDNNFWFKCPVIHPTSTFSGPCYQFHANLSSFTKSKSLSYDVPLATTNDVEDCDFKDPLKTCDFQVCFYDFLSPSKKKEPLLEAALRFENKTYGYSATIQMHQSAGMRGIPCFHVSKCLIWKMFHCQDSSSATKCEKAGVHGMWSIQFSLRNLRLFGAKARIVVLVNALYVTKRITAIGKYDIMRVPHTYAHLGYPLALFPRAPHEPVSGLFLIASPKRQNIVASRTETSPVATPTPLTIDRSTTLDKSNVTLTYLSVELRYIDMGPFDFPRCVKHLPPNLKAILHVTTHHIGRRFNSSIMIISNRYIPPLLETVAPTSASNKTTSTSSSNMSVTTSGFNFSTIESTTFEAPSTTAPVLLSDDVHRGIPRNPALVVCVGVAGSVLVGLVGFMMWRVASGNIPISHHRTVRNGTTELPSSANRYPVSGSPQGWEGYGTSINGAHSDLGDYYSDAGSFSSVRGAS